MKKNIMKSIFHFDRFDMDRYQKIVDAKNGVTRIEQKNNKPEYKFLILKISVLVFIVALITLSILTICFIGE